MEGGYKATWKRGFKLPWREAGTPKTSVDPDQQVVNKELSLWGVWAAHKQVSAENSRENYMGS